MRALIGFCLVALVAPAPFASARAGANEDGSPYVCDVRDHGKVVFHGLCATYFDLDRIEISTTTRTYRIQKVGSAVDKTKTVAAGNRRVAPLAAVSYENSPGQEADLSDPADRSELPKEDWLFVFPSRSLSIELTSTDEVFARPRRSTVSHITHKLERVGQCFDSRVKSGGGPPSGDDVSGEAWLITKDGHEMTTGPSSHSIDRVREGDQVHFCVLALPRDCPPGDTRGITYRGVDKRAGAHWTAWDAPHSCGGQ